MYFVINKDEQWRLQSTSLPNAMSLTARQVLPATIVSDGLKKEITISRGKSGRSASDMLGTSSFDARGEERINKRAGVAKEGGDGLAV